MNKANSLAEAFTDIRKCPVCDSPEKKPVFKNLIHTCNVLKKSGINLKNENVLSDIYECANCKHRYLSVVVADKFIKQYYSVAGSEYYDLIKNDPYDRNPKLTHLMVKTITRKSKVGSLILEIGSGTGHLLSELGKVGYMCYGVEPNEFISDFSKKKFNLNVKTGILDYYTFPETKFDVIILSDVIEHIYDANSLFRLVYFYLKPGGNVIVLTGNSKSVYAKFCGIKWEYFFSWEHISFFNRSSIRFLFEHNRLRMTSFEKLGHSAHFFNELKVWFYTIRGMVANFFGMRNHRFFYMAFDHFIAIGEK
ncbi:MAG: class I SAM-dependent methyltransferase [Bacteroidetes bacterium]|nr:class I SAM-dependent methyltransferase [Bacteroidota bacterium]